MVGDLIRTGQKLCSNSIVWCNLSRAGVGLATMVFIGREAAQPQRTLGLRSIN
jgi:hypothetical protein